VLETVAARLAAEGLFGMALEAALAALRSDPLRESAHRAVIRIHLAEGNLAEAAQAYRQCRALLARELGVEPSEQTAELVRRLPRALSVLR
jgi:DNA-binding SARP family transcriptional activator